MYIQYMPCISYGRRQVDTCNTAMYDCLFVLIKRVLNINNSMHYLINKFHTTFIKFKGAFTYM